MNMKLGKLTALAVAGLFLAAPAQALSLLWGTQWAFTTDPDGTYTDDSTAIINAGITGGTAWLLVLSSDSTAGFAVDTEGNLVDGGNLVTSFTKTFADPTFAGDDSTDAAITETAYYAMVVYDPSAQMYGISDTQLGSAMGLASDPPAMGNGDFSNVNLASMGGVGVMAANVQAVPEPTSMALIGLGAAAIALRKRFGKKV